MDLTTKVAAFYLLEPERLAVNARELASTFVSPANEQEYHIPHIRAATSSNTCTGLFI